MKKEDFIYVADQGHCPYGTKSFDEIKTAISKISDFDFHISLSPISSILLILFFAFITTDKLWLRDIL